MFRLMISFIFSKQTVFIFSDSLSHIIGISASSAEDFNQLFGLKYGLHFSLLSKNYL
jgi:hypothetical protein